MAHAPSISVVSKLALEVFKRQFPVILMVHLRGGGYITLFIHKHAQYVSPGTFSKKSRLFSVRILERPRNVSLSLRGIGLGMKQQTSFIRAARLPRMLDETNKHKRLREIQRHPGHLLTVSSTIAAVDSAGTLTDAKAGTSCFV